MAHDQWDGDYYKENSKEQESSAFDALIDYKFRGDEQVLDIGCGDGKITAAIAREVPKGSVIGLDFSADMIRVCNEQYSDISNLKFFVADAANFSVDQKFDLVTSFFTLHWVKNQAAALETAAGLLKPGGTVVIRMAGQAPSPIGKAFEQLAAIEPWKAHFSNTPLHYYPGSEEFYKKKLNELGFSQIDAKIINFPGSYNNCDELHSWFMGWVPYCTGLSPEKNQEFVQALAKSVYKECGKEADQEVVLFSPILHVTAKL